MKHFDIEEKIIENKKKVTKISLISLAGVLSVGLIVGLTLTIVNSKKPIKKTADELRSNFILEETLPKIKTLDFTIKNLGMKETDKVFEDYTFFSDSIVIKSNLDISNNEGIYYSITTDGVERKTTNPEEVQKQIYNVVENLFYHKLYPTLNGGLIYSVYDNNKLLIDKKESDSYLLFDESGVILEGLKENNYSINFGRYYKK